MFPELVEASINLPLRLFHRFRRHVPDLLFDIVVAILSQIQFRRTGWQPFDTDPTFRRQILFYNARAMGIRTAPDHYQRLPEADLIKESSRSRATRTGCWTLQPGLRNFSLR